MAFDELDLEIEFDRLQEALHDDEIPYKKGMVEGSGLMHPADYIEQVLPDLYEPGKSDLKKTEEIRSWLSILQSDFDVDTTELLEKADALIKELSAPPKKVTLTTVRKKYKGQKLDLAKLREVKDVWNVHGEDKVVFHFFWGDGKNSYMDHVRITLDQGKHILDIEPMLCERQTSCGIQRSTYVTCRTTTAHYSQLDHKLSQAIGDDYPKSIASKLCDLDGEILMLWANLASSGLGLMPGGNIENAVNYIWSSRESIDSAATELEKAQGYVTLLTKLDTDYGILKSRLLNDAKSLVKELSANSVES